MTNLEFYKEEIHDLLSQQYLQSALQTVYSRHAKITWNSYDILNWLCEEHQILDKEEKEYLSNVIRPFRGKVESISKRLEFDEQWEYIAICYKDRDSNDLTALYLPCFKKGAMYKGMELIKEYTLQELGL